MVRTPGLCHPILMLKKAIALATTPTYSHLPFRILWQALFATTTKRGHIGPKIPSHGHARPMITVPRAALARSPHHSEISSGRACDCQRRNSASNCSGVCRY